MDSYTQRSGLMLGHANDRQECAQMVFCLLPVSNTPHPIFRHLAPRCLCSFTTPLPSAHCVLFLPLLEHA